jgi:hypothetical protein
MGLQMVSIIMASGALIGAIALLFVRYANTSEAKLGGGVREGMSG